MADNPALFAEQFARQSRDPRGGMTGRPMPLPVGPAGSLAGANAGFQAQLPVGPQVPYGAGALAGANAGFQAQLPGSILPNGPPMPSAGPVPMPTRPPMPMPTRSPMPMPGPPAGAAAGAVGGAMGARPVNLGSVLPQFGFGMPWGAGGSKGKGNAYGQSKPNAGVGRAVATGATKTPVNNGNWLAALLGRNRPR